MNENINLCEILKDCPHGTKFYSSTHGTVTLNAVKDDRIIVLDYRNCPIDYSKGGRYCAHIYGEGECTIFPSKDQRDWSKWKRPKPKIKKFDPKTLKPFDKVLVRDKCTMWYCGIFTCIGSSSQVITTGRWDYAVPYNDDTKHLAGTREEAPEYYRYWGD